MSNIANDTNIRRSDGARKTGQIFQLLVGFSTSFILAASGVEILPSIGLGLFVYSTLWFVDTTGNEIAIAPVVSMIATAQWAVGPYLAYYHDAVTLKYRMYVPEDVYFEFVVPALLAMVFAMRIFSPKINIDRVRDAIFSSHNISRRSIYYLFIVGAVADFSIFSVPNSLKFVTFIGSQFVFIASIYMIVLRMKYRWVFLAVAFTMAASSSIEFSLFHILLLWSTLIASYICAELRLRFTVKLAIFVGLLLLVIQLQAAKAEYRLQIHANPESAGIGSLIDSMVENALFQSSKFSSTVDGTGILNARLNQGWIISAIMNYMPAVREFENGGTILDAIEESMLPRFLVDKKDVNISSSFMEYTGLLVSRDTSFGISVLGESWVNFGEYGIIFMGLFGIFYANVLRAIVFLSRNYPTVLFWIPLIFLQGAKAETELVIVLNHIIKSGLLVAGLYFFCYKVLGWRI
ncbi:MAG: hypothetical protein P1U88_23405 [Thalassobaculaceae bacterium]|nr:hypothetical protein [Thalassobaculaceae bacterium]